MLAQGICQQIYEKNDNNQYQSRAVGDGKLCIQVCAAGGYDVQVIGQGHALVEDAAGKLGQEVGGAGEEDGRRLARHTAQGQNQTCDDIGHTHGQDDVPDGLELRGTQRTAALAHAVGDGLQRLLGRADDKGQGQQAQRERTGQDTVTETQVVDKQGHAKQAEHDGRNAAQVVGHHPDEADNPALRGILVHIDTAHHAHRESEQGAAYHQPERADDGGPDAAGGHAVLGGRGQEVPVDDTDALDDDESQDGEKYHHHSQTQQTEQAECDFLRKTFSCCHKLSLLIRHGLYREVD